MMRLGFLYELMRMRRCLLSTVLSSMDPLSRSLWQISRAPLALRGMSTVSIHSCSSSSSLSLSSVPQDLLADHRPDPLGQAAVDLRMYDEYMTTLLRLKGNMIVPATNPFPDQVCVGGAGAHDPHTHTHLHTHTPLLLPQEVYALTAAKGVVVSHHHYDLVGSNVFAWPLMSQGDCSWTKDPGSMAALWQASIAAQAALPEVLWSVGLRGLNDYAYPCSTPQVCVGVCGGGLPVKGHMKP